MAETTEEACLNQEDPMQKEEGEENNENVASTQQNSSFLIELSLVMILASLALSDEELAEFEDVEKVSVKEQEVKSFVPRLHNRKRQFDELKVRDRRQASRLQPRILDSRHGRKM